MSDDQKLICREDQLLIQVDFWMDNKKHWASRNLVRVPDIGDEVRFNQVAYKINYRIWVYDEKRLRAVLNMTEIKQG